MLRLERGSIFDGAIPDCATVTLDRQHLVGNRGADDLIDLPAIEAAMFNQRISQHHDDPHARQSERATFSQSTKAPSALWPSALQRAGAGVGGNPHARNLLSASAALASALTGMVAAR
jgi:hypothetical protein